MIQLVHNQGIHCVDNYQLQLTDCISNRKEAALVILLPLTITSDHSLWGSHYNCITTLWLMFSKNYPPIACLVTHLNNEELFLWQWQPEWNWDMSKWWLLLPLPLAKMCLHFEPCASYVCLRSNWDVECYFGQYNSKALFQKLPKLSLHNLDVSLVTWSGKLSLLSSYAISSNIQYKTTVPSACLQPGYPLCG